jgi:hypothetical protein
MQNSNASVTVHPGEFISPVAHIEKRDFSGLSMSGCIHSNQMARYLNHSPQRNQLWISDEFEMDVPNHITPALR